MPLGNLLAFSYFNMWPVFFSNVLQKITFNTSFLAALRAQFLIECVTDLKKNLMKRGINLLIKHGKPEDILPSLVKTYGVHTVKSDFVTCLLFAYVLFHS